MKRSSTSSRLALAVAAGVSLLVAFLAGRGLPVKPHSGDGIDQSAAAGPTRPSPGARRDHAPATWREAWDLPTAADRTIAVLELLDRCQSREEFLATIAAIQSGADKSETTRFLALLFEAWLESDPLDALSEVRRVEALRHDPGRVAESFRTWAFLHPDSAAGLLRQVLDGRQGDPGLKPPFLDGIDPPEFLLSLVSGLGSSNPSLAADTLAGSVGSPVRTTAIEVLLQDWYPADPSGARNWAASIADPETRQLALVAVATKAGQGDQPGPALTWAMALPAPRDQEGALKALTGQWSQRHAAGAFAWTRTLPDGDLKFAVMPGVLRQLAIINPGAAADWLNEYEAAPAMDPSIAAYARAIQFINPPAALGSAAAITDSHLRETLTRRLRRNMQLRGLEPDRGPPGTE